MFIQEKLKLKIKEEFFRCHKKSGVEVDNLVEVARLSDNLNDLVYDLGADFKDYRTDLAINLRNLRDEYSKRVAFELTLSPHAYEVLDILAKNTESAHMIGGAVRDSILEKVPKDFDFCTNLPYDELEKLFKENGYKVQEEGKQFLVLIVSKGGHQFEIANYRKDGTYVDGRRPDSVSIGTIEEDSNRRDLTINALYYCCKTATIYDPTGLGISDITDRVLRFVGSPKVRIKEDYLRGWRFLRFLSTHDDFSPVPKHLRVVRELWLDIYLNSNPQRVLGEIEKMCKL